MSKAVFPPSGTTLPQRLRAAAARLFQVRGYEAVTIDDIVAEVGGTKGAFYYYFPSKTDLLLALHKEYVAFSIDCFRDAIAAAAPDPERELEAFVYESFRQIHEYREYVGLLFDERRSLPADQMVEVNDSKTGLRRILADIIDRGIAGGVFRQVDSRSMSLAVFGACTWGYLWYKPDGRVGYEALAAEFTDLALRGLAAD